MYTCESWTIKNAECRRIDAFELWCWRRLLRVPWTARKSNQSILREINPEYLLEGLMLKLKLQYFGHLMLERLRAEGEEGIRRWGGWMASPKQWTLVNFCGNELLQKSIGCLVWIAPKVTRELLVQNLSYRDNTCNILACERANTDPKSPGHIYPREWLRNSGVISLAHINT